MPRQATGTVRYEAGRWEARFTRANKSRTPWEPLPTIGRGTCCPTTDPKCEHRQQAEALAASMAPKVKRAGNGPETVTEWFKRLHASKEAKGLSSVGDMRGRYRKYVATVVGEKQPCEVTTEDLERIVARLDKDARRWIDSGGKRGQGISPSTAANVWGDLTHAFDEMVRSKDATLRVLKSNPCANVRGPDAGDDREGQILYSDELLALLRGPVRLATTRRYGTERRRDRTRDRRCRARRRPGRSPDARGEARCPTGRQRRRPRRAAAEMLTRCLRSRNTEPMMSAMANTGPVRARPVRVAFYLSTEEDRQLEDLSEQSGLSRSDVLRQALREKAARRARTADGERAA